MARKEDNRIYLTESEFNNIITEAVSLLLEGRPAKWNYEECYNEAKKYTNRDEFKRNAGGAYRVARKNDWLKDYTWFAPSSSAKKWNYETCYNEAKKYTSRKEFERNAVGAYRVALKNGWLNDYTWFEKIMGKWDYEECYNEAKKYTSRIEFQKNAKGAYASALKNNWLDDYTWFAPSLTGKKWDYDSCYQEAKKYKSKSEFKSNARGAYEVALKNGWLDDYTWFEKKWGKWDYDACYDEAKKYKSRSEFSKNSVGAYDVALRNGWLNDYTWFEKKWGKWDYDACYNEAKKYSNRRDFRVYSPHVYRISVILGWLNDYTWLEKYQSTTKNIYIVYCYKDEGTNTVYVGLTNNLRIRDLQHRRGNIKHGERIYDVLYKYYEIIGQPIPQPIILKENLYANEAQDFERYYVEYFKKEGWNVLNIAKAGSLGALYKWTEEKCYQEAKKYTSRGEFQKNSMGAYTAARKNGWLNDYTWFEQKIKPSGYWDYNACYNEARKYKSKSEFKSNARVAYKVALKNGWLKDYTWFERPSSHKKKWNYETCYQEAKKYTSRGEFAKNARGAYEVALKNGWLEDYTWFNKPATKKTKNISLNELKSIINREVNKMFEELRSKNL